MSAYVLCGDAMLRLPSARIARDDVAALSDSAALLAETKALQENASLAAEEAERLGYERGREQAAGEMRDTLAAAIAQLTEDFAKENARREREVATAAMQAVEQMLGRAEPAEIVTGIARQALQEVGADLVEVVVAPQWVETIAPVFADAENVVISGDPDLGTMGCRLVTIDGRIIADLETQLASLRARWGLADELADD